MSPGTRMLSCQAFRRRATAALLGLAMTLAIPLAHAKDYEVLTLGPDDARDVLVVDASTNTQVFLGVLRDFSALYPTIRLVYTELPTQVLYDAAVTRAEATPGSLDGPDVVISSSMDLQAKLANDGLAQPHVSQETLALPGWARWRDEVFSIGAEAMVMAYNTQALTSEQAPRTRRQLLAMLRDPALPLQGRIGTYDVEHSGIGYLAATQDTRLDSMAGTLLSAFGANAVVVDSSADETLDRLARGEISLAYNVLESYALRRIADGAPLAVARPEDYTLVVSRAAIIPKQARRPDLAAKFLDYLLSARGQHIIVRESAMLPVRPLPGASTDGAPLRPVDLGVGLLVYLDELKKSYFLRTWHAALCLDCGRPAAALESANE